MQLTPSIFSRFFGRVTSRTTVHPTSWAVCSCRTGRYRLPGRGRSRADPAHASSVSIGVGLVMLSISASGSDVVVVRSQLVDLAQKVAQHRGIDLVILGSECRHVERDGIVRIQHRWLLDSCKGRLLHVLLGRIRKRPKVPSGIVEHPMHALICDVIDMSG